MTLTRKGMISIVSRIYNREYYEHYDVGVEKVNYADSVYTKDFLTHIADRIVEDIHPASVLDAGCAMGHLVAALRDRGVNAYGIDISEYAISHVREDIRPYCSVGSLTEPLPQSLPRHYDLVISIEVLEHLYPEDGEKAIKNICSLTDRVIFSSSPDDFSDPTHVNVRQREYWARLFAEEGFFDDLSYRPTYLTAYASAFTRCDDSLRQIEEYERNIRLSEAQHQEDVRGWSESVAAKEQHIVNLENILKAETERSKTLSQAIEDKDRHIHNQNDIIETVNKEKLELKTAIEDKDRHIREQNDVIEAVNKEKLELKTAIEDQDRHIREQNDVIEAVNKEKLELKIAIEDQDRHIREQSELLISAEEKNVSLENLINAQSEEIWEEKYLLSLAAQQTYELKTAADVRELELTETVREMTARWDELSGKDEEIGKELAHYKEHYFAAINQREDLKLQLAEINRQLAETQNAYNVISNAAFWKITKPFRVLLDLIKRPFQPNGRLHLVGKAYRCLKENGPKYTWRKVQDKLRHRNEYRALAGRSEYTAEDLAAQKEKVFSRKVRFSIVVPLYNTPQVFLREMIQSVLDQTYADWELCMADGSDSEHGDVKRICQSYARKDERIKYKKLEKNYGISGNTNACLEMASGDYIALFDHDDLLHPAALYEVMQAICDQDADFIYTDENTFHNKPADAYCPHFKPDFAPDTLRSYNYICHFTVFSARLLAEIGEAFRSDFDGSQDYDMVLRLTEKARRIVHIPIILYYWRSHASSVASDIGAKPYTITAAKAALAEHLDRVGLAGKVYDSRIPSTYRIRYEIKGEPTISILIPNKDHISDLDKCVRSIREKSTYRNWEIIIIENNSTEQQTFDYYTELQTDKRIRVVYWKNEFNYSAINNFGAQYAAGEHLLLLNNDVEVITPEWLEEMLMFSQRTDVGAVGAMLYYPDDTIQHAGVVLGIGGVAGHSHKYFPRGDYGYMSRLTIAQNYSAVTAACLMMRRDVWNEIGGLNEDFKVAFNDVDLCMRIRAAGYLIVWTPYAELYHYESKSRGLEDTPEKQKRFESEVRRFLMLWENELAAGDPYYNPNFTLEREDFSIR